MAVKLNWTGRAHEDLLEIYCLIAEDNPSAAERDIASLEEAIRTLAVHPRMGPRRPEIRPSTRILVENPYLILYETEPDTDHGRIQEVNIVPIVDGRRDLPTLFGVSWARE